MKPALEEDQVLKPVSPAIADDNDWPIFHIQNADVFSADPSQGLTNLLFAADQQPLTVVGKLDKVARGQNLSLLSRGIFPTSIRIRDVQRFAYGQFEDGEVAFWAAGKAGWFEIHPSRQYKQTYKAMTEAINMLYFAADFYRDLKPKQLRQTPAKTIFELYANESACKSVHTAERLFSKHRDILVTMMADGKENVKWAQTKLYEFLAETNGYEAEEIDNVATPTSQSEDDEDLPARLAGKGKSTLRPTTGALSSKAAARQAALAVDADADSSSLKRKSAMETIPQQPKRRGRPAKNQTAVQVDSSAPEESTEDDEMSSQRLPVEPLERLQDRGLPNTEPPRDGDISISKTALPSFAANLPGDVWACGYDGCSHKVFAASSMRSHTLISEHYRKHAHECQAALDLIHREQRPYLPVSHLIKRIRGMAAQQKPLPPESDPLPNAVPMNPRSKTREPVWMQEMHKYPQPVRQKH